MSKSIQQCIKEFHEICMANKCSECPYKEHFPMCGYVYMYEQGRAEAYDEVIEHISLCEKEAFDNGVGMIGSALMATRITVERMKEQKHEQD